MDPRNRRSIHPVKEYQIRITRNLRDIFRPEKVEREWVSRADGEDTMYFPRIDIAVGPFAVDGTYEENYDYLLGRHNSFIEDLRSMSAKNGVISSNFALNRLNDVNRNARCFLAIEIENSTISKHVLGSIVNAVALGRIGVLVAWEKDTIFSREHDKLIQCLRLKRYMEHLTELKKNSLNLDNLLILDYLQFEQVVLQHVPSKLQT